MHGCFHHEHLIATIITRGRLCQKSIILGILIKQHGNAFYFGYHQKKWLIAMFSRIVKRQQTSVRSGRINQKIPKKKMKWKNENKGTLEQEEDDRMSSFLGREG